MKSTRCEEVIVQVVVRSYDESGRPVKEQISQAIKVFRNGETRDFWGQVDKFVASIEQQQAAQAVSASKQDSTPSKKRGARI